MLADIAQITMHHRIGRQHEGDVAGRGLPFAQSQITRPITAARRKSSTMFWPVPDQVPRIQARLVLKLHLETTVASHESSRASPP